MSSVRLGHSILGPADREERRGGHEGKQGEGMEQEEDRWKEIASLSCKRDKEGECLSDKEREREVRGETVKKKREGRRERGGRAERLLICSDVPWCSTLLLCEVLGAHSFDFILFHQTWWEPLWGCTALVLYNQHGYAKGSSSFPWLHERQLLNPWTHYLTDDVS